MLYFSKHVVFSWSWISQLVTFTGLLRIFTLWALFSWQCNNQRSDCLLFFWPWNWLYILSLCVKSHTSDLLNQAAPLKLEECLSFCWVVMCTAVARKHLEEKAINCVKGSHCITKSCDITSRYYMLCQPITLCKCRYNLVLFIQSTYMENICVLSLIAFMLLVYSEKEIFNYNIKQLLFKHLVLKTLFMSPNLSCIMLFCKM